MQWDTSSGPSPKISLRFAIPSAMTQPPTFPHPTAQRAFQTFTHGLATGDWNDFLAMLTDDFHFWFPMGPYKGHQSGKTTMAEFLQYVNQTFPQGLTLTQLERVTSSETTVVFEFRDEGYMGDKPYKNRVAVSFDFRDDQICCYREYFGSDGSFH